MSGGQQEAAALGAMSTELREAAYSMRDAVKSAEDGIPNLLDASPETPMPSTLKRAHSLTPPPTKERPENREA